MKTNWKSDVIMIPVANKAMIAFPNGSQIHMKKYDFLPSMYFKTYIKREIGLQPAIQMQQVTDSDTYEALVFLRKKGLDVWDIRYIKSVGLTQVFEIYVEASQ